MDLSSSCRAHDREDMANDHISSAPPPGFSKAFDRAALTLAVLARNDYCGKQCEQTLPRLPFSDCRRIPGIFRESWQIFQDCSKSIDLKGSRFTPHALHFKAEERPSLEP